jgi:hypothetical protein
MTWAEYIITYLIPTWFQSFAGCFRIWRDLMTGNYADYALMWYDDPYEECYNWFWSELNEDPTLPKHFLEHIRKLAEQVRTGEVKTYTLDEVFGED